MGGQHASRGQHASPLDKHFLCRRYALGSNATDMHSLLCVNSEPNLPRASYYARQSIPRHRPQAKCSPLTMRRPLTCSSRTPPSTTASLMMQRGACSSGRLKACTCRYLLQCVNASRMCQRTCAFTEAAQHRVAFLVSHEASHLCLRMSPWRSRPTAHEIPIRQPQEHVAHTPEVRNTSCPPLRACPCTPDATKPLRSPKPRSLPIEMH